MRRILEKLHILKPIDFNSVKYLRSRGIKIGENVDILNSNLDGSHGFLITIGSNVTITNAVLLTHDASTKKPLGYSKVGRINIGDNVFIGHSAIILPGTTIGSNVIVGAGCVVAQDIPDNSVVIGNPSRILCSYDEYITRQKSKMDTCPIYHTLYFKKSDAEKEQMYLELKNSMGFDL